MAKYTSTEEIPKEIMDEIKHMMSLSTGNKFGQRHEILQDCFPTVDRGVLKGILLGQVKAEKRAEESRKANNAAIDKATAEKRKRKGPPKGMVIEGFVEKPFNETIKPASCQQVKKADEPKVEPVAPVAEQVKPSEPEQTPLERIDMALKDINLAIESFQSAISMYPAEIKTSSQVIGCMRSILAEISTFRAGAAWAQKGGK